MPRTRFYTAPRKNARLSVLFRYSSEDDIKLQLTPHAHLDKMRDGTGDRMAWQTLKYRLNVGSMLAATHYAEHAELRQALVEAVEAVASIGKRYMRTGKFGCTGDEFRAIGQGLNLCDELQKATTRKQQRAASCAVFKDDTASGRDLPVVTGRQAQEAAA